LRSFIATRNLLLRNEKTTRQGGFFEGSVSWGTSEPR